MCVQVMEAFMRHTRVFVRMFVYRSHHCRLSTEKESNLSPVGGGESGGVTWGQSRWVASVVGGGRGKQQEILCVLCTSNLSSTFNPNNCPVTTSGTFSLQCLIIFNNTKPFSGREGVGINRVKRGEGFLECAGGEVYAITGARRRVWHAVWLHVRECVW